jgi:NADPH-dependent 2,4-dienoyl-CoA reductase/sulfur reductase-like enzyme
MGTRLLVVGGDAAGMSAAMQARRRVPDLEVVAVERGRHTSYSACGIPFLAAGTVGSVDDLVARSPDQLRAQRIDVRTGHEVTAIDLDARRAEVHNLTHGRTFALGFDLLLLATGGRPARPDIEGADQPHVHGVQTLDDATRLLDDIRRRRPERAAVIGGGYIGLEMAEAFARRGLEVTVIERGPEVMGGLDPDLGAAVGGAMRGFGIDVRTGVSATAVRPDRVETDQGDVPADLVLLGTGVVPNAELAAAAGLATGARGALVVDRRQRTSDAGVWAAGDCCQSFHLVSGRAVHQPLGTVANRQGRVAGVNLSGGYATFPGVLGTAVTRVCSLEIGRTGLNRIEAEQAGFGFQAETIQATTAAGYMPEASAVTVKMLAEMGTGRLLGVQVLGGAGAAKRVDVAAAAIAGGLTVEDLIGLDLAYAPPFSPVWDPLQVAARALVRKL